METVENYAEFAFAVLSPGLEKRAFLVLKA
jgi:hypothetical protein